MIQMMYFLFTMINLLALNKLYWPFLKTFLSMSKLTNDWTIVCLAFALYVKLCVRNNVLRLKQWWHETVVPMNDGTFMLMHRIDGEDVRMVIKKREDPITTVVDENYEECYTDEARPFLTYAQEKFCSRYIGVDKTLIMCMKSGRTQKSY